MNKNYWKRAGNAKWGLEQLFKDIRNHKTPRGHHEKPRDNTVEERKNQPIREDVKPSSYNASAPVYNYYNYNYPSSGNRVYRTVGLFKTILLIVFLSLIVVITYYLITEPRVLVDFGHRIVDFFHSL